MPFFSYRQNNSGGAFIIDPSEGISTNVIIEAADAIEADHRAGRIGLYFDGIESGQDCDCCGGRWSEAYGDGYDVPTVYGDPVVLGEEFDHSQKFAIKWSGTDPDGYVHFLDGRVEAFGL